MSKHDKIIEREYQKFAKAIESLSLFGFHKGIVRLELWKFEGAVFKAILGLSPKNKKMIDAVSKRKKQLYDLTNNMEKQLDQMERKQIIKV